MRKAVAVLGLGAFALLCLTPDLAQAQRWRRGSSAYYTPANYGYGYPGGSGYGYGSYDPCSVPSGGAVYGGVGMSAPVAGGYNPQSPYGYPVRQPMPGYAYGTPPQPMPGYPGAPPVPYPGSSSTYQPPVPMPGLGGIPGQPAATLTVNISDQAFDPKILNIGPGTLVTWINRGQHPHTVTFPDVNRDSGDLPPGGTFQAIFPVAGTYPYFCRHHPEMKAAVSVGPITTPAGGTGVPGNLPTTSRN